MSQRALADLRERVQKLERSSVHFRRGVVTDTDPLSVALGGNTDFSYADVSSIGEEPTLDEIVAALVWGKDMVVLGSLGVGGGHGGGKKKLEQFNWLDYCKGDGTNDRDGFQAMVDDAEDAGGGLMMGAPRTFVCNGTVNLPVGVPLRFDSTGMRTCVIERTSGTAPIFEGHGTGIAAANRLHVEMANFTIDGGEIAGPLAIFDKGHECVWDHVTFVGNQATGVQLTELFNSAFKTCFFLRLGAYWTDSPAVVSDYVGDDSGTPTHTVHFDNCEWEQNRGVDCRLTGLAGSKTVAVLFSGGKMEGGTGDYPYLDIDNAKAVGFSNFHIDCHERTGSPVVVDNQAPVDTKNAVRFNGLTINGLDANNPYAIDQLGHAVQITGAVMTGIPATAYVHIASGVARGAFRAVNCKVEDPTIFVDDERVLASQDAYNNLDYPAFTSVVRDAGTDIADVSAIWTDTYPRYLRDIDGMQQWGPGIAALDTNWYRFGADRHGTNDAIVISRGNIATALEFSYGYGGGYRHGLYTNHHGGSAPDNFIDFAIWTPVDSPAVVGTLLAARLNGNGRLSLPVQGVNAGLLLGGDALLYRVAAGVVQAGGLRALDLESSGYVRAHSLAGAPQTNNVVLGWDGSADAAGMVFGAAWDTYLKRKAAAAELETNRKLFAVGLDAGDQKITNVANGSAADDAAAFGQIPTSLPPNGSAGGVLDGSYPNPGLAAGVAGSGLTETSDVLAVGAGSGISVSADAVAVDSTVLRTNVGVQTITPASHVDTALQLLSGNAADYAVLVTGRTAAESYIGTAAAANDLVLGTAAGDTVVGGAAGKLHIGIGTTADEIRIENAKIGVLGTAAVAKQTVTGSRGGNAALASLLTAMAAFGWITDSSTA